MLQESETDKLVEKLQNPKTQREAFSVLVKEYSEPLYWQIRKIVLSHDDANLDKYQQKIIKHPALKKVNTEADMYIPFASAIFLLSHREAFS